MADEHTGIQYKLRLPPELKEKIAISAKEHNRSMNADIVARLEQTFSSEVVPKGEASALIQQIKELLEENNRLRG